MLTIRIWLTSKRVEPFFKRDTSSKPVWYFYIVSSLILSEAYIDIPPYSGLLFLVVFIKGRLLTLWEPLKCTPLSKSDAPKSGVQLNPLGGYKVRGNSMVSNKIG